jgi:hypothetical protein
VGGHGNVDTFREMLRIKRSIQAQYNTQVCEDSFILTLSRRDLGFTYYLGNRSSCPFICAKLTKFVENEVLKKLRKKLLELWARFFCHFSKIIWNAILN